MIRDRLLRAITRLFFSAATLCAVASAQAPQPHPLSPPATPTASSQLPSPSTTQHPLTADDLGAFLDGLVPYELKREDIAGAVVVVVKDGKVLYQKGYGYADVKKQTPVTPETLFRAGSVSKLFTWTAVMQLVQAGKIDLHADINQYLDFKIPATYPQPITMWNLMTHTPGFEEAIKDLIVPGGKPIPIREYLVDHMPKRVYPPGVTPAYSNYGATLAGYIVQRVSGMPFDDYVQQNIFAPLGMSHSTFRQPIPAALQPWMSSGYTLASQDAKLMETVSAEPAGSSTVSAPDMAHFMIAHLHGGEYNGARILSPATTALMHSPQFAVDPALPHMALGFYEETRNGHRIIGHAGDTQYFHSDLHLVPDQDLGFFVSYNSSGVGEVSPRTELFNAFLDRYLPYQVPAAATQAQAARDADLVSGEYVTSRRPVTTIFSFLGFVSNIKVIAKEDGTISVDEFKDPNQVPKTFVEIGPLLYREKGGQDKLGFTRDADHRLALSMDYPFMVWTKTPLVDSKVFNYFLLGLIVTVALLAVLWWPISVWVRRHYQHPLVLTRRQHLLRVLMRIVLLLELGFVLAWVLILTSSGGDPLLSSSMDPLLRFVQVIGWLGTLGTLVVLYAVISLWRAPNEWWLTHAGNVAIAVAAVCFSWMLLHWHLLAFSMN